MDFVSAIYQSILCLLGGPFCSQTFRLFVPNTMTSLTAPSSLSTPWNGSLDSFIAWERPISLENILCNIGPECVGDESVGAGIVLASPSKADPDCKSLLVPLFRREALF